MEDLHLIVGLGNPGLDYVRTRHNAGFMLVESLAGRWKARWQDEKKFCARVARAAVDGSRPILCQPQTFMNASGEAVGPLASYFKVPPGKVLVAVDDADLPLGEIRLRGGGGSGGHHGLVSVEEHLGTREYPRLRLGIGRTERGLREISGHVLAPFSAAEQEVWQEVLTRAADQVECWIRDGLERAMNRFNGVVTPRNKGN